jgi:hypothetical protein
MGKPLWYIATIAVQEPVGITDIAGSAVESSVVHPYSGNYEAFLCAFSHNSEWKMKLED